jgi:hypothetical protein
VIPVAPEVFHESTIVSPGSTSFVFTSKKSIWGMTSGLLGSGRVGGVGDIGVLVSVSALVVVSVGNGEVVADDVFVGVRVEGAVAVMVSIPTTQPVALSRAVSVIVSVAGVLSRNLPKSVWQAARRKHSAIISHSFVLINLLIIVH